MGDINRYHGLDLLRGVAMLLGLLFHANMVYLDPEIFYEFGFAPGVNAPEVEDWIAILTIWIHAWRMPLFFLLAGFFAVMIIERKGAANFLKDRTLRLGGVLVVFVLFFNFALDQHWGQLDHLWFIWVLLIYCVAITGLVVIGWVPKFGLSIPIVLATLIPLAWLGQFRYDGVWLPIPEFPWEFPPSGLAVGFLFFLLGVLLFNNRPFLARLSSLRLIALFLTMGIVGFGGTITLFETTQTLALNIFFAVATLGWVFAILGLANRSWVRSVPWVQTLVTLSYPIYVLHLVPVMGLTAFLITFGLPSWLVLPMACVLCFGLCTLVWAVLIRPTPLNTLFNGRRLKR